MAKYTEELERNMGNVQAMYNKPAPTPAPAQTKPYTPEMAKQTQYGNTTIKRTDGPNGPTFTGTRTGGAEPRGIKSVVSNVQPTAQPSTYNDNPMQRQMLSDYRARQRSLRESQSMPLAPSEFRYRTDMRNARVGMQDPNRPGLTIGQRRAAQEALDSAVGAVQAKYKMDRNTYDTAAENMAGRLARANDNDATRLAALEAQQMNNYNQRSMRELQEAGLQNRLDQEIASREKIADIEADIRRDDLDMRSRLTDATIEDMAYNRDSKLREEQLGFIDSLIDSYSIDQEVANAARTKLNPTERRRIAKLPQEQQENEIGKIVFDLTPATIDYMWRDFIPGVREDAYVGETYGSSDIAPAQWWHSLIPFADRGYGDFRKTGPNGRNLTVFGEDITPSLRSVLNRLYPPEDE